MLAAIRDGFGKHTVHIEPEKTLTIWSNLLGAFMTGVATSGIARISIATLLLRFTIERAWRIAIWMLIGLQLGSVLAYEIVKLAQCQLVIGGHRVVKQSYCFSRTQVWALNYMNVGELRLGACPNRPLLQRPPSRPGELTWLPLTLGICTLSDLVCTALPIFVVWHLSRSVVEKTLVIALIATTLLATSCAIPKIYYLATYEFGKDDSLWRIVPEVFWCRTEEAMIIIAACMPLLKGPIERCLRRVGLPHFDSPPRTLSTIQTAVVRHRAKGGWPEEGAGQYTLPHDVEGITMTTTKTETSEREYANR